MGLPYLTIEHAIENGFTDLDFVRYFRPKWTDQQCHDYLWESTCYPFSTNRTIAMLNNQLNGN